MTGIVPMLVVVALEVSSDHTERFEAPPILIYEYESFDANEI